MATEVKAGVTTFMVMATIIFVNPSILSAAGIDPAAEPRPPPRRPAC